MTPIRNFPRDHAALRIGAKTCMQSNTKPPKCKMTYFDTPLYTHSATFARKSAKQMIWECKGDPPLLLGAFTIVEFLSNVLFPYVSSSIMSNLV